MIRNESEHEAAVRWLQEERDRLSDHKAHIEGLGLADDEVKRAVDPSRAFREQLAEDVGSYERLMRGDITRSEEELNHLSVQLVERGAIARPDRLRELRAPRL